MANISFNGEPCRVLPVNHSIALDAQRPGSAAAVLTRGRSQPHASAVGWNPVLGDTLAARTPQRERRP
jgi:hypothetical protein